MKIKLLSSLINKNEKPKNEKSNYSEPNKPRDLNQPSVKDQPESGRWKKPLIIGVITLIVAGIAAGIIVSLFATGPSAVGFYGIAGIPDSSGNIKDQDSKPTADSFTIYTNPERTEKRTIFKGDALSFYYDASATKLRVTTGNNFTGFYFLVNIITPSDPNTPFYVDLLNVRVETSEGLVKYAVKTTDTTTNNSEIQFKDYSDQNTLLSTKFIGAQNNTRMASGGFDWSIVINLLTLLLPIIIFILLWRMMKGAAQGGGQDNVFSIGKSQAKIAQSTVKFTDVAGIEEEKNELIEVVDYLKRPEKYVAMGARVPKGVILYGPPGTGKTLLAKAVAGEAEVPFFQVSGSAFEDMLVGVGAKRVRDLFNKAIKAAPAIIFIDEIDSVGSKRGKLETTSGSLADQTLNQLLAEMDGFSNRSGVIVMAATNRLDVLDEALLRPGRFDRHIQVNLPDIKERSAILKIHARNKNLSSSVDLDDIARRTPGFSGAQLENTLNEATLLAVRKNKNSISTDDIDEAIDRVIAGPAKTTKVISPEEKKQIAYHEAGHALVGLHIKGGDVVQKITIIPRGQAAGYTLSVPEIQELSIQKKSDLLGMIASTLGGRASEEIVYGKESVSTGAANDLYKVTNVVRAMVMQLGMSEVGMTQFVPSEGVANPYQQRLFSETTALSIDKEIDKIIKKQYEVACNIIKKNKKELDLIVESLLLLETIIKPQIDYIHKNLKLPEEALLKKQELLAKKKEKISKAENLKKVENQNNKENSGNKLEEKNNKKDLKN
ncbi:ATP-dependent zinc metalloprotease FtsH [Malacoplasma muris]|uniref:ATP-dependent zinc metalloprotease FtsH n=1 Tax=Malacoplasma muris TaxID=2119 RepID=UPI00398EB969